MDILYTGRGLSTKLPEQGNAMQGLANFVAKAEETKFNVFQKNKDAFMKMTDVDPVMFLTTANQEAQAKLLDEFNKEAAQIYKNSGGFPSMEEMQQIQAKKNFLISKQQEMKADMERYLADRDVVSKDFSGNIDQDLFKAREDNYLSGKTRYGTEPLVPSALDPDAYYSRSLNKGIGTAGTVKVTVKKNGQLLTEERKASATEPEAREMVAADILKDPRLARGYIQKFQKLKETDPETYIKYLDADQSGTIDETEAKEAGYRSNPIIQWAQDNYWQKKIRIEEKEEIKPETVKPKSGFDINIAVGAGNNKNQTFDVRDNVSAYGTTFGKLMNLGRVSFTSDPQTIDEYVDLEKGTSVPLGAATRIEVVSYSPDKDLIVAKVVDDVKGKVRSGKIIGLSGAKYNDLLKSKPFYIDRESLLKQYGGQKTEQTKGLLD